jgi:transcriptional regulator NrdR family protein
MTGHRKKHTMPCLSCGTPTQTKETRATNVDGYSATIRRRVCPKCGDRFTSYELPKELMRPPSIFGENRDKVFDALDVIDASILKIRCSA